LWELAEARMELKARWRGLGRGQRCCKRESCGKKFKIFVFSCETSVY
jgi:hypothetical protein